MGRPKGSKNIRERPIEEHTYRTDYNMRRTMRRYGKMPQFVAETTVEEAIIAAGIRNDEKAKEIPG